MTGLFSTAKVKDLMTPHPLLTSPSSSLEQAAKKMESIDCGSLPVGTEDKLVGMITDRDIVVRALAQGKSPATTKVADCMTKEVYACHENDSLETAAEIMHKYKVSRLIVKDKEEKVTGILSFGIVLREEADPREIVHIVKSCCGPVSVHR